MAHYVCSQLDVTMQTCASWVETTSLLDLINGFAITGAQTGQICTAIGTYLGMCWMLKKARKTI